MQDRVFRLSVIQNIHERLRESNLLYVPLITYCGDQALGFEDATALVHDGLYVQVNLCQKLLFLHQLTHNMMTDCSLFMKIVSSEYLQNMLCTQIVVFVLF